MKIDIVTIFPRMLEGPFSESMVKRAMDQGLVEINRVDLRSYAAGRHRQVDDAPYGGGRGMVFKPEPLFDAVGDLKQSGAESARVILMSPQGRLFDQEVARKLAAERHLIILCGHYEGVDERAIEGLVDDEISIGDYVLTGGEIAAAVVVDTVVRLLPGLLPAQSVDEESFSESLLEYPQYTRPAEYRGRPVPEVLLSGNHAAIDQWRRHQSLERTRLRRPDLLKRATLSREDQRYLEQLEQGTAESLDTGGEKE